MRTSGRFGALSAEIGNISRGKRPKNRLLVRTSGSFWAAFAKILGVKRMIQVVTEGDL